MIDSILSFLNAALYLESIVRNLVEPYFPFSFSHLLS